MDAVCEILDARIPLSSRNPDVDRADGGQAPAGGPEPGGPGGPGETRRWTAYFREKGYAVLEANAKGGAGTAQFAAAVRELLRGQAGRLGPAGPGGPHRAGHGAGDPQRGQVHLY